MKYFKLKHFYFLAVLLLVSLSGCNREPVEPPAADGVYLQGQVDQHLTLFTPGGPASNCLRSATHVAGQYALIEVVCDAGVRMEFVYHASGREVFVSKVWYVYKDGPLLTEEQIMTGVGAPQMEAWMLVDMRDHPHVTHQGK